MAFGFEIHDTSLQAGPFVDMASIARSINPIAVFYLTIFAGGAIGILFHQITSPLSISKAYGIIRITLVTFNPIIIWSFVYGVDALLFFLASLVIWRGVSLLADHPNHTAVISLGGAIGGAGVMSSYILFTAPSLIAGLIFLSPWRFTTRKAFGFSLAVWSPLVMVYLAYFYIAWMANASPPRLSFEGIDFDHMPGQLAATMMVPLMAPSLLAQVVRGQKNYRRRVSAAIILITLLSGSIFAIAFGGSPYFFAISAFAAQIVTSQHQSPEPSFCSALPMAIAFVSGSLFVAISEGLNLFELISFGLT